jgi:hypothetical protein
MTFEFMIMGTTNSLSWVCSFQPRQLQPPKVITPTLGFELLRAVSKIWRAHDLAAAKLPFENRAVNVWKAFVFAIYTWPF